MISEPRELSEKINTLESKLKEKEADAALAATVGQELLKQIETLKTELERYQQDSLIAESCAPSFATPVRNRERFLRPSPAGSPRKSITRRPSAEHRDIVSRLQDRLVSLQGRNDELQEIIESQRNTINTIQRQKGKDGKDSKAVIWELEMKNQNLIEESTTLKTRLDKLMIEMKTLKDENKILSESMDKEKELNRLSLLQGSHCVSRRSSRVDIIFPDHRQSIVSEPQSPTGTHDVCVATDLLEEEVKIKDLEEKYAQTYSDLRTTAMLNVDLEQKVAKLQTELEQYKTLLDHSRQNIESLKRESHVSMISLQDSIELAGDAQTWISGLVEGMIMTAICIRETPSDIIMEEVEVERANELNILVSDGNVDQKGKIEWKEESMFLPTKMNIPSRTQRATFSKSNKIDLGDLSLMRILSGGWVYKEVKSRITGKTGERRKYMWINPWNCRVYWSKSDPDSGKAALVKSGAIRSWTVDGDHVIVNSSEGRVIFRGEDSLEHQSWIKMLKMLRLD